MSAAAQKGNEISEGGAFARRLFFYPSIQLAT
jgi:hypothetical protein